ncbi:MAG: hypothetical protein IJT29_03035 [Oscillospiraceae bacterium]|nr:hypothetical protein [Oscillospiraceae bacterium]
MNEKKTALNADELGSISGGVASPGAVMVCTAAAPLYESNPLGNHFRSTTQATDNVQPGTSVKLYEYGTRYCKVICNGKVGWIETAFLANK